MCPCEPRPCPQVLGDDAARELCLRFADMECKLGEVDRARAIYTYCSQICDPRVRLWDGEGLGRTVPSVLLSLTLSLMCPRVPGHCRR